MIEYSILKINNTQKNDITIKEINLDYKLDFFLLIESNDNDYIKILEQKIIDLVIDNISKKEAYKDFSLILGKINHILKIYYKENTDSYINALVAISNDKDFIFSQIGSVSLYLIKEIGETIEITDSKAKNKEFNYISEGYLEHNDILVCSSSRLLNYLSYSDFVDSAKYNQIEKINKNIELILKDENIEKNIGILTIRFQDKNFKNIKKSKFKQNFEKIYFKIIDNNYIKTLIAYFKIIEEKLEKKSKLIKNILIFLALITTSFIFFSILSGVIKTTSQNNKTTNLKQLLYDAKKYKTIASNNYTNPEQFELNISQAEDIINKLRKEKMYLNDVKILEEELNTIKKTFNGVEVFKENLDNLIYKIPNKYETNIISNININSKDYIITKQAIIGPILKGQEPKEYVFKELKDDEFIDATPLDNSIILLTKKGKIVEFNLGGYFSFKDVQNQDTWEKANTILSYGQNLYLINKDNAQIYKHSKYGKKFKQASPYLKPEDQKYIGKIESIAIDGGFYILKDDLKVFKFFSKPYRLETITLNKIPKTYKRENNSKVKIIARKNLNYVYMLLNNKIWIFKPNTPFFQKTKALRYLGQIEATKNKIIDFYIEKDSIIKVLLKTGLYKISFNENDGKILVNN